MGRASVSVSPTSPEELVHQLNEEGYAVALLRSMLVVSHVPYLRADGSVATGDLLVPISVQGDLVVAPRTHTAWWTGQAPHEVDGSPLRALNVEAHRGGPTIEGLSAMIACCKPHGREYRDHREFVLTYIAVLGAPVAETGSTLTARIGARSVPVNLRAGVFAYLDTASARSDLGRANEAVEGRTVGIVGLGGTGSYILDLLSKCGVRAIHLFDDDVFEQHSAFRAPGAAKIDDLRARRFKVEHFAEVYRGIHRRVVPHVVRIDERSVSLLDMVDFVFLSIDDAAAKPPILRHLADRGIGFVDAGMGLQHSDRGIVGAVRTTLVASGAGGMMDMIPTVGDPDGAYATNIQICELNALNAALAVIAWKRHVGFYAANRRSGNEVYIVEDARLHLDLGETTDLGGEDG